MRCPKCDFQQPDDSLECMRCGVIFSKLGKSSGSPPDTRPLPAVSDEQALSAGPPGPTQRETGLGPHTSKPPQPREHRAAPNRQPVPVPVPAGAASSPVEAPIQITDSPAAAEDQEEILDPEPLSMDSDDLKYVGIGLAIAAVATAIPLLRHIFGTFMILVHEMGHTVFGWLFGYPSLPAFDFMYGGGITFHLLKQSVLILVVISAAMLGLMFVYRHNVKTLVFLSVVLVGYLGLALTDAHHVIIIFMGHGFELVIAAIFLYRGFSGAKVIHPAERPLYSGIGFFIVFRDLVFAYRLMTSPFHRAMYEDAKGGGHWMDFSRIAEDFLHTDLTVVAGFFFLCCLFPILLGYLTFRYSEYIRAAIRSLVTKDPHETSAA